MKSMKTLRNLAATAAIAAMPAAAGAQDWDGFYGGLTLGYTAHDATHTFSNGAPTGSSDPDGLLYGGFAGYAFQSGNTVYGAEIGFEGSNASGSYANFLGATSSGRTELNWQGTLRGVLGYATGLGSRPALIYGALGYSYGDFDFGGGPAPAGFATNGYSDQLDGWTVAVGLDTRVSAMTSVRVEYAYTDYGTARGSLFPGFPAVVMPVSVEQHALRFGVRMDLGPK
ncbi:MAG: outer membrane beta-barrel protein [Roseovarius sp.]|nr:outer membrane beta-barrel protein [Roseovarius sp.]